METGQPLLPHTVTCCIVGGGPAGVMAGFLLARAGIDVLVLEKHDDFFRDFRGDTIHPSTLELLHKLELLNDFLTQPHQQLEHITVHFGDKPFHIADFMHLNTHCKFIAFMPQWDFLTFLSSYAKTYPHFHLCMGAEVKDLIIENNRVAGVKVQTQDGMHEVHSILVLGADGRHSTVRTCAGLEVIDSGAPIDVIWFRITKHAQDPKQAFGFVNTGQFMVLIDRDKYWQCAYVIPKGSFEQKQQDGLDTFRQEVVRCVPFFKDRILELRAWGDIKLLSVRVDHLRQWYCDGLLCIGDSAHAMSPVGGVGINLAIQDAVAAARILSPVLRAGKVQLADLRKVQKQREWPTRMIQRLQIFLHTHLLERIFKSSGKIHPPFFMRLMEYFPLLRRVPAMVIGIGFRPEHFE